MRAAGVPDYLWWAALCTLFFFLPLGLAGLVCSVVARRRAVEGDTAGARRSSQAARRCCWAAMIVTVVLAAFLLATGSHLPTFKS